MPAFSTPAIRASKFDLLGLACLVLTPALAKSNKPILPSYILEAHTVTVMIDPAAGISLEDPNANQTAQRDVETALLKWGRFTTVISPVDADLVIVLRKGHGKLADVTISDPRQNSRVGSVSHTDGGISIGAQHGLRRPIRPARTIQMRTATPQRTREPRSATPTTPSRSSRAKRSTAPATLLAGNGSTRTASTPTTSPPSTSSAKPSKPPRNKPPSNSPSTHKSGVP